MKHINVNSETCSGCSACTASCTRNAIAFETDKEGFLVPIVDESKCVECGLCLKTCPSSAEQCKGDNKDIRAYAFQNKDDALRYDSASGAFFPAIARYFIEVLKGYVCGCVLDETVTPKHIVTNQWSDVQRMQDSKYVQSDMGNCMSEIVTFLRGGNYVLFTGTSCQCNGIKSLVEHRRVNSQRLLTVDFFCHGVPSPLIWKEYLKFYEKELKRKPIGYRFRCKEFGWGVASRLSYHLNTIIYKKGGIIKREHHSVLSRMWRSIFFSNICLRRYCHSCPYTTIYKPADITMADFWGIEDYRPELSDGKGCSLLIAHNNIADALINALEDCEISEVEVEAAIKKQANAFAGSLKHPNRDLFWNDYYLRGFDYVMHKYFNYNVRGRIKSQLRYLLFITGIRHY